MVAVVGAAISGAGTAAVSCELFTNEELSATPFQYTVDPDTNPVPETAKLNVGPPGTVADGTSGFKRGTALGGTEFACTHGARPNHTTANTAIRPLRLIGCLLFCFLFLVCFRYPVRGFRGTSGTLAQL